jgi:hypothetical protein
MEGKVLKYASIFFARLGKIRDVLTGVSSEGLSPVIARTDRILHGE